MKEISKSKLGNSAVKAARFIALKGKKTLI
jgi:hypothetical protein